MDQMVDTSVGNRSFEAARVDSRAMVETYRPGGGAKSMLSESCTDTNTVYSQAGQVVRVSTLR